MLTNTEFKIKTKIFMKTFSGKSNETFLVLSYASTVRIHKRYTKNFSQSIQNHRREGEKDEWKKQVGEDLSVYVLKLQIK